LIQNVPPKLSRIISNSWRVLVHLPDFIAALSGAAHSDIRIAVILHSASMILHFSHKDNDRWRWRV
jgi:hypothetical protein